MAFHDRLKNLGIRSADLMFDSLLGTVKLIYDINRNASTDGIVKAILRPAATLYLDLLWLDISRIARQVFACVPISPAISILELFLMLPSDEVWPSDKE